jgi:probable phosphoglycerate mutase
MRLIITRHGETEDNMNDTFAGQLPGKLTPLGVVQAEKVAVRLKNEKIDVIYSSDLKRASDTAIAIHRFHPSTEIILTEELRERHMGEYQGKSLNDLGLTRENFNWSKVPQPSGGETLSSMLERASKFLHRILLKHSKETVLVVAHEGICKAIIASLIDGTVETFKKTCNLDNTSITIYNIQTDGKYSVETFNCMDHLEKTQKTG